MRPNLKTLSIKEQIQGIERTPQPIKTPFNGIMVKDKEGSLYIDMDIYEFLMEAEALNLPF